ncbi:hypothetical protein niasHS_007781 [Heterodera schachtii]|uniref:Uncharacterized protein n=1 Tax=Heterodera schachtii TaxID=97005 RepID=A0ABD2JPT6_HETSC
MKEICANELRYNATDQSSIGPNVRQWLQLGYWLLCALFLLFCAYPLFKLARERIALYILISKLLPALLFLFSSVLSYPFVIRLVAISQIVRQNLSMFSLVNHRLHIVALAANRAFAIILPILYSHKITKRCVLLQCVFLHLFSILLAPFYIFLAHYSWTYLIVSSSFYVAIAIKLAWIKAKNRSLNASQSVDKNSGRITLLLLILCEDVRDLFARMIGKVFSLIKKLKLTKIANVATQQSNQLANANTRHYINQLANANTRHYSNQLANANTPHYANANTRHYSNQLANANTPHYANANSRHYSNQLVNANSRHYINQLANANTRHYSNQLANANTRQQ